MKVSIISSVCTQELKNYVQQLTSYLKAKGHDINVVLPDKSGNIVLKQKHSIFSKQVTASNKPNDKNIREAVAKNDVVYILNHHSCSSLAIKICRELEIPYVTAYYPELFNKTQNKDKMSCKLKKFYKKSHLIACNSEENASKLIKNHLKAQKYVIPLTSENKLESSNQIEQMFLDAINYYQEYYSYYKKKIKPQLEYPENAPHTHIVKMKYRKPHKIVDEKYNYAKKKYFFYHFGTFLLRLLAWFLIPIWAKLFSHYKIYGKKNLKRVKHTGVLITCNHVHLTDAPLMATRLFGIKRKVRFVMLSESRDIPVAGPLLEALGGVPLGDTINGMKHLNGYINILLKRKKPVLIFPEASLWPYYRKIRPFSRGTFLFAEQSGAPILPVIITFRTRRNGKQKMIINILKPIYPEGKDSKVLLQEVQTLYENFVNDFYSKYR